MAYFRIDAMHKLFGVTPGEKCRDCPHLLTYEHGRRRWFKCSIYGTSPSTASDWAKKWPACGLFDKPAPKGYQKLIKMIKSDSKKIMPIEGQIDIFGGVIRDR